MSSLNQNLGGNGHDTLPAAQEDVFAGPTMLASRPDVAGDNDTTAITPGQKMLSAISGSLLTSLLVTPLDVVRVRLQSQSTTPLQAYTADLQKMATSAPSAFRPTNLGVTACCREVFFMNNNAEACLAGPFGTSAPPHDCAVELTQRRTFTSTFDGLRKIARNEGFTTLWRGLSPTLVMAVPANIIYFTGYESLRFSHSSPIQRTVPDAYAPLVAGAVARVLAATAVGPIELFRTRLQASSGATATGHLANTFKGIQEMVTEHGYRSLWRGITLTLWRDVPFSGLYWWGYETIRGKLTDLREARRGRPLERDHEPRARARARSRSQSQEDHSAVFTDSFVAGSLSGAFASIVTMPFDVGKTRTQTYQESAKKLAGSVDKSAALAPEEQSMTRLLWHIFRTEGIPGLWRGWIPRTLKVAPACAIMISSYEVGKRVFRGMNERAERKRLAAGEAEA